MTLTMTMTLDMNDPMTKLSPLDIVLVTMATFGPSNPISTKVGTWYRQRSLTLETDIDDPIVTLGHSPGDHGHFWAIDPIFTKVGKQHCQWSPTSLEHRHLFKCAAQSCGSRHLFNHWLTLLPFFLSFVSSLIKRITIRYDFKVMKVADNQHQTVLIEFE